MQLGLGSVIPQTTSELKKHSIKIWDCDWIMLNALHDITPVYDANMWRIYAAEYNKNVEFLSDDELKELCNMNKENIDKYIAQNVTQRLDAIVARWTGFAQAANDTFMGMNIPTAAHRAFKSFLSFHKNNDIKDDEVSRHHAFAQLHGELIVNSIDYGDTESRYPLTIEQFREFVTAIKYEFQNLASRGNVVNSSALDYKSRLKKAITYINALLLVCIGGRRGHESTHALGLFENLIRWSDGSGRTAEIIRKTSAMGGLSMAHAVCIYPDSDVKIPSTGLTSTKVTDTYRFLTTMLLQREYINQLTKDIGRS